MAFHCGHCNSPRTNVMFHTRQCETCGEHTYENGEPADLAALQAAPLNI